MSKRALINIDYTYDFVADDGRLTSGKAGQAIEQKMIDLTKQFAEKDELVVFAIDMHVEEDAFHPETKLFPPHNIEGTIGRELYGRMKDLYEEIKERENVLYMDKTRYSAFAGTDLEMKLRARSIEEVHLIGVCTDICLLHTAVDAYNKGFQIVVHRDAAASFDRIGHEWALKHFANTLGAKIV